MGYSTDFNGELKFTKELTASQLATLSSMLGEDCREHQEWEDIKDLSYIDLELLPDFSGLKWDGAEKTYFLDRLVNVVIREMRKVMPDFGLTGKLSAQGEDVDDRWELVIGEDGFAQHVELKPTGTKIRCPKCEENFYLE